jgi:regulatory protein
MPQPPRSLKARALQWLAQREHSRVELRRKLQRFAAEQDADAHAEDVEAALDWLEANAYLSPQRFVESRVHARAARWGNLRIRQELQRHDLAPTPEQARALQASELGRARAVHARRFPHPPRDAAERARQARFLIGRGFSSETVRAVLRAASSSARDAGDDGLDDAVPDDALHDDRGDPSRSAD